MLPQDPRPLNESQPPDAAALPDELRALEAALGTLRPSGARLDRDRLFFEAGRRAARQPRRAARWAWPAATAALGVVAASLLLMLTLAPRPKPQVVKEVVVKTIRVPVETPSAAPEERSPAPTIAEHSPPPSWWRDSAPVWNDGRDVVAMRVRVERLLRELRAPGGASGSPDRARKTDGDESSAPRLAPPTPYYQLRDQLLREQRLSALGNAGCHALTPRERPGHENRLQSGGWACSLIAARHAHPPRQAILHCDVHRAA